MLAFLSRSAGWSVLVAGALTTAFASAAAWNQVSARWALGATAVFAAAVFPVIVGFGMIGIWRSRRQPWTDRRRYVDAWIVGGLVVWTFIVRLEPAHQPVGPTSHLGLLGAIDLLVLAVAGLVVIRAWERRGSGGVLVRFAVVGLASLVLLAVAAVQDPQLDRSAAAAAFRGVSPNPEPVSPAAGTQRVLVVGVDGLDWEMLSAVAAHQPLPVLDRIMAGGRRWSLETAGLQRSPEIWTTIHTGVAPAAHGVWGFTDWHLWKGATELRARPYFGPHLPLFIDHLLARLPKAIAEPRLATAEGIAPPAFWEVAAGRGVPSVVVSPFPITSPLMALEGAMAVRDYTDGAWHVSRTHDGRSSVSRVPESEVATVPSMEEDDGDLVVLHAQRVAMAERLFREVTPRLGVFYTSFIDDTLHRHWRAGCGPLGACPLSIGDDRAWRVREAFARLDADIGRLMTAFGPDSTLMLVSDHGWETGGDEHVFGPDGVMAVSPSPKPGFGGRVDVYHVAPTILGALGVPGGVGTPVARTQLRKAAQPSVDRLQLLKSVGYIAR